MIDPLIEQARTVNFAATLDANLAARREARPARSKAALKGWQTRQMQTDADALQAPEPEILTAVDAAWDKELRDGR